MKKVQHDAHAERVAIFANLAGEVSGDAPTDE
jgi:hypothetical protein